MLAWEIGLALAAGCCVVVKPAEETSLTVLRVVELAVAARLPRGVFNVWCGAWDQTLESHWVTAWMWT